MAEFIVTGFGPFHGVTDNPTSAIVQSLTDFIQTREQKEQLHVTTDKPTSATTSSDNNSNRTSLVRIPMSKRLRTFIIDTSYKAAQKQIDDIYHELVSNDSSSRTSTSSNTTTTIILHLGVHNSSIHYQIESCAYNEMNFVVPDEYGDQPINEMIISYDAHPQNVSHHQIHTKFHTVLPTIANQMNHRNMNPKEYPTTASTYLRGDTNKVQSQDRNTNVQAQIQHLSRTNQYYGTSSIVSTDPGRFVCNYIYYYSLHTFQASQSAAAVTTTTQKQHTETTSIVTDQNNSAPNVKCLFLHVPPFTVASLEQQLSFVTDLMTLLENEIAVQ
jgi:pyrrolidone-carboxylate peptidase